MLLCCAREVPLLLHTPNSDKLSCAKLSFPLQSYQSYWNAMTTTCIFPIPQSLIFAHGCHGTCAADRHVGGNLDTCRNLLRDLLCFICFYDVLYASLSFATSFSSWLFSCLGSRHWPCRENASPRLQKLGKTNSKSFH